MNTQSLIKLEENLHCMCIKLLGKLYSFSLSLSLLLVKHREDCRSQECREVWSQRDLSRKGKRLSSDKDQRQDVCMLKKEKERKVIHNRVKKENNVCPSNCCYFFSFFSLLLFSISTYTRKVLSSFSSWSFIKSLAFTHCLCWFTRSKKKLRTQSKGRKKEWREKRRTHQNFRMRIAAAAAVERKESG